MWRLLYDAEAGPREQWKRVPNGDHDSFLSASAHFVRLAKELTTGRLRIIDGTGRRVVETGPARRYEQEAAS